MLVLGAWHILNRKTKQAAERELDKDRILGDLSWSTTAIKNGELIN